VIGNKSFWVSWYHDPDGPEFELWSPWWISGWRPVDDFEKVHSTVCAAIKAENEDAAKAKVLSSYDEPVEIEWRFVEGRPDEWSPFSARFPKAKWMDRLW